MLQCMGGSYIFFCFFNKKNEVVAKISIILRGRPLLFQKELISRIL